MLNFRPVLNTHYLVDSEDDMTNNEWQAVKNDFQNFHVVNPIEIYMMSAPFILRCTILNILVHRFCVWKILSLAGCQWNMLTNFDLTLIERCMGLGLMSWRSYDAMFQITKLIWLKKSCWHGWKASCWTILVALGLSQKI